MCHSILPTQEKWRVRQEESLLKAMQESIQCEREQQLKQLARERRMD